VCRVKWIRSAAPSTGVGVGVGRGGVRGFYRTATGVATVLNVVDGFIQPIRTDRRALAPVRVEVGRFELTVSRKVANRCIGQIRGAAGACLRGRIIVATGAREAQEGSEK
jgi:hypothetical protein